MADNFRIVMNPAKDEMYMASHDELIAGGAQLFEKSEIVCREMVGWIDENGDSINENTQVWSVRGDYVFVSLKTFPETKSVNRLPEIDAAG